MIAVIIGLILFVIDVFAFNGDDFTYVVAGVITIMAAAKWLLAWYPLRKRDRALLLALAAAPWVVAYLDSYPSLRAAAVINIALFGLALIVQSKINGRAEATKKP